MNSLPKIDPIVLYFERQGHYLQPRQLAFCRFFLDTGDQRKSAKRAGFVDPASDGAVLYSMYRETLDMYREHANIDWDLAVNAYRRMAAAENMVLVSPATEDEEAVYEPVPNYTVQKNGADGLCKVFGFNAAEKVAMDLTHREGLPPALQEKMDNAHKAATES